MSKTNRSKDKPVTAQILPFEPGADSQNVLGSFQALQTQSNALLTNSTEIQRMMQTNRQTRLNVQQKIADSCRLLKQPVEKGRQIHKEYAQLATLRMQILELDNEHVQLHQRFITLQAHIRQVVRNQRRSLVQSINQTRARTASKEGSISLVSSKLPSETEEETDALTADQGSTPLQISA